MSTISSVLRVVAAGVALTALVAAPAAASVSDDPPGTLNVTYDASGTSRVKKTNSTVALGPTVLTTKVRPDGTFTGSLPLPPATTEFKLAGFLPVRATVNFEETAEGVTGVLTANRVRSKAHYVLRLSDVTLGGLPTFVGENCRTSATVTIPANTPPNGAFSITKGGVLIGGYTIPSFANCGLTTGIINQLVPGPGNRQQIRVSNGAISTS